MVQRGDVFLSGMLQGPFFIFDEVELQSAEIGNAASGELQ